jgi:vancomycin aglycone glucosyltransferase
MRVLLSTIGTRGDVQPVVALASELKAHGQEVRVCVPPDFREWVEGLGIPVVPIGPEVRGTATGPRTVPTPEELRRQLEDTVATQFTTITAAAQDCDVIVGCNGIQVAAHSIAEQLGIHYVFTGYCPTALFSPYHAPIPLPGRKPADETTGNLTLWADDAEGWNRLWGPALNSHRAAAGQAPVTDVRGHIMTGRPWLAADPTLAPWPEPGDEHVVQTGAWILPDQRPLSPELEAFLDAGEPPIYFGFGSIRTPEDVNQVMVESARALGRRVIVLRGWADVSLLDNEPDCLSIGEVNQQALFKRVAVAVHHGGAGTTTAATRAGVPQVVVPQHYDQPYFARQIDRLGIGAAHPGSVPTTDSLTVALSQALQPDVATRAQVIATKVRIDGTKVATQRLMSLAAQ